MSTRLEEVTEKINELVEKQKNGTISEEEKEVLPKLNEELSRLQTDGKQIVLG